MFGHEKSIAESLMKPLAEFVQVLGNQTGDYEAAQANIVKMVRAGNLMGQFIDDQTRQIDVEKLTRFLDLGAKVIAATHGMVNASTWFNLAQTGGPSLMNMSEQGLMSMAIASQAMGGYRAGTALMSMFQQFIGGVVTPWRAENLHELGLVGDYKVTKGGHILWAQGALDTPFCSIADHRPDAGDENTDGAHGCSRYFGRQCADQRAIPTVAAINLDA